MLSCSVVSDSFQHHWTVSQQASLSMEFPREEYWSDLPFPPPEDLCNPGVEHTSHGSPALTGRFFPSEPPGEPLTVQADIRLAVAIDQDLSDVRGCYVSRFQVLAEESWCDFHSQIWYIDFMYCLVTFS